MDAHDAGAPAGDAPVTVPADPAPTGDLGARLEAIESKLAIGQLPIRYAMAVDARDLDEWVSLFVPDVRVGRDSFGRDALRRQIEPSMRRFGRSVHQLCGHRIELVDTDASRATGSVYCRAEHEVGERWIVMAICYFDEYRRVGNEWLFERRRERHWYAADVAEHPQEVGFDCLGGEPPALPAAFPTWDRFWTTPSG